MSRLRSLYVLPFMLGVHAAAIQAAVVLTTGGWSLSWAGALLASGSVALWLDWTVGTRYLLPLAPRTSRHVWPLLALVVAGVAMAVAGLDLVPALEAAGLLVGWLLYNYGYAVFHGRRWSKLEVGKPLPAFELLGLDGDPLRSADLLGSRALLLFYRGNWCPLCMAQIREVAGQYEEIARRGVKVVLISPQPERKTVALARRFDVDFTFAVDPDSYAARRLGILDEGGLPTGMQLLGYDSDTVLPTVVLVERDGTVLAAGLTDNYRLRPDPIDFLRLLDEIDRLAGPEPLRAENRRVS